MTRGQIYRMFAAAYPSPMRCRYPSENGHLANSDGTCATCTYFRDLSIWEDSPLYVEGQVY